MYTLQHDLQWIILYYRKYQNHYIVYSDMMLMSKHCSSIYFICKTTFLVYTLSVTVMLLLTDFTSAPDDKSTRIEYCQKIYYWASTTPADTFR